MANKKSHLITTQPRINSSLRTRVKTKKLIIKNQIQKKTRKNQNIKPLSYSNFQKYNLQDLPSPPPPKTPPINIQNAFKTGKIRTYKTKNKKENIIQTRKQTKNQNKDNCTHFLCWLKYKLGKTIYK